jgi:hypothetical protein
MNSARRFPSPRLALMPLLAAALVLGAPARGSAQVSGALEGGWYDMTNASNSAKAVFDGKSGGPVFGLSVRVPFGRAFFVSGHGRLMTKSGEKAFVEAPGKPVFRLGHPLDMRIIPAYALLGYEFGRGGRSSLHPYVGLGAGVTSYREESDVAGVKDTFSATKPSYHAAIGADYGRGALRFGLELAYSSAPQVIGEAGVSKVYGEDDIGGATIVGRICFGGR